MIKLGTSGEDVIHLLKLLTGVDNSTRPVRSGGRAGNDVARSNRIAAPEVKRTSFWCFDTRLGREEANSSCFDITFDGEEVDFTFDGEEADITPDAEEAGPSCFSTI